MDSTFSTPCAWCVIPHRPGEHNIFSVRVLPRRVVHRFSGNSRCFHQFLPLAAVQVLPERGVVVGVLRDEIRVDHARFGSRDFEQRLGDSLEQRDVAGDVRLQKRAGDVRAEQQAARVRRHAEIFQAALARRVDDDHLAAPAAYFHQRAHEARVVRRRVRANQKKQVDRVQVFKLHRRRAGAQTLRQADAGSLMAIVRAVVDVVGAVQPREQLQQESRLVRGAAAGVKKRPVRRGGLQAFGNPVERFLPGHRPVMRVALVAQHRLHQPSAGFQFARRPAAQRFHIVFLKEIDRQDALHVRSLGGDGLVAHFGKVAALVAHAT